MGHRPPLQWCQQLRYLTDKNQNSPSIPTAKSLQNISENFFKKYKKYLRNNLKIRNEFETPLHDAYYSTTIYGIRNSVEYIHNDKAKTINKHSEELWSNIKTRKKNKPQKSLEAPAKDLTALASFPVIFYK